MSEKDKSSKVRQYQIADIIKDPVQLFLLILAVLTVLGLVPFTKASYDYIYEF